MKRIPKMIITVLGSFVVAIALLIGILLVKHELRPEEIKVDQAATILQVNHLLDGIIPYKRDYYYIAIDITSKEAYIIKGPKDWHDEHFTDNFQSKDPGGVLLRGSVQIATGRDIKDKLEIQTSKLTGYDYPYGTDHYLDMSYKTRAVRYLFLFSIPVMLVLLVKTDLSENKLANNIRWTLVFVMIVAWVFLL